MTLGHEVWCHHTTSLPANLCQTIPAKIKIFKNMPKTQIFHIIHHHSTFVWWSYSKFVCQIMLDTGSPWWICCHRLSSAVLGALCARWSGLAQAQSALEDLCAQVGHGMTMGWWDLRRVGDQKLHINDHQCVYIYIYVLIYIYYIYYIYIYMNGM